MKSEYGFFGAGILITAIICAIVSGVKRHESPTPLPANVDTILTVSTQSEVIYLMDSQGVQVGRLRFGDEITVMIRRKK